MRRSSTCSSGGGGKGGGSADGGVLLLDGQPATQESMRAASSYVAQVRGFGITLACGSTSAAQVHAARTLGFSLLLTTIQPPQSFTWPLHRRMRCCCHS